MKTAPFFGKKLRLNKKERSHIHLPLFRQWMMKKACSSSHDVGIGCEKEMCGQKTRESFLQQVLQGNYMLTDKELDAVAKMSGQRFPKINRYYSD